jgi:hypothetical protein
MLNGTTITKALIGKNCSSEVTHDLMHIAHGNARVDVIPSSLSHATN